jgi:hypothetical protein
MEKHVNQPVNPLVTVKVPVKDIPHVAILVLVPVRDTHVPMVRPVNTVAMAAVHIWIFKPAKQPVKEIPVRTPVKDQPAKEPVTQLVLIPVADLNVARAVKTQKK